MSGAIRIFRKDLLESLLSWRSILLNLLLPPLLVLLVGQLRTQQVTYRVLVAGAPQEQRQKIALIEDLSPLRVTTIDHSILNPLDEIRNHGFDLVANFDDARGPGWSLYTAETDAFRLRALRQVTSRLKEVLDLIANDTTAGKRDMRPLIDILANPAPRGLWSYFPQAEISNSLTPEILALLVCFLPFTLAASSVVRERQVHTVEIFLSIRGIRPSSLFWGKSLFPALTGLVICGLSLILVQASYDLHLKSNFLVIVLLLCVAVLGSSFMGLTISSLVTSHTQALTASVAFFFGFTLLSGFLYPVSGESAGVVYALSRLFPLTFVHPIFKPWMYGADPHDRWKTFLVLLLQAAVYGVIARLAFQRMLRRI